MLDLYGISELSRSRPFPAQFSQQLRSSSQIRQSLADTDKLIHWQKPCGELLSYWNISLHLKVDGEAVTVNRKLIRLSTVAQSLFTAAIPEIVKIETTVTGKQR